MKSGPISYPAIKNYHYHNSDLVDDKYSGDFFIKFNIYLSIKQAKIIYIYYIFKCLVYLNFNETDFINHFHEEQE